MGEKCIQTLQKMQKAGINLPKDREKYIHEQIEIKLANREIIIGIHLTEINIFRLQEEILSANRDKDIQPSEIYILN